MKKILFSLAVFLFLAQIPLMAQLTDQENIVFNADLHATFNLNVVAGATQDIDFVTPADYNFGVDETGGIVSGVSEITIEATGNWNLQILAPDFSPITGTGTIPIDNLGVWCEALGPNDFTGPCTCPCQNAATALGLGNANQEIIGLGAGNMGDATDNWFNLHWRMGTMDNGTMHATSMFDQMANGDFTVGTYTTTAVVLLTEIP